MEKKWEVLGNAPESFYNEFPELPQTVANLLYHRDIRTQQQVDEFLNPDYSEDIHDPYLFNDMEKTVKRIFKAIKNQEKIIVYGDYDADGVSASVILVSTLRALGADNVDVFIPHREIDGYGLNNRVIEEFAKDNVKVIITCDCGISNTNEVALAGKKKIDVIITDHHSIPEKLPKAFAIIHPKIETEKYPDKNLSGGGVAFKLMQGLLKKHKEKNELLTNGIKHEAHEKWMLDMVAISSVADMVPLIGESRTLTKYGLIVLNKTQKIGLKKLFLETGIREEDDTQKREIDTYTIGFQIAPRINAAGRIKHANVAYELMMAEKGTDAVDLAYQLDQNNKERQEITQKLVDESVKQVEAGAGKLPVLFIIGYKWPPGVVGLIAGRIKEKYYKPTLVMSENEEEIMGSGRSIDGFNIIAGFQQIPEVFSKFGGHPMACGFTLESKDKLEEFKTKLVEEYHKQTDGNDVSPKIKIDAEVTLEEVDWDLYDLLEKFKPFGVANEKPKYLARNLQVHEIKSMGKDSNHMRMMLKQNNKIRKTVGWNLCYGSEVNWCEQLKAGDIVDIVFEVGVNEWNGNRELQLTVIDLKKAE